MKTHKLWITLLISVGAAAGGCADINSTPGVQNKLKVVSAGYTGCSPGDNVLSNVAMHGDGSGIWNATCKGKPFLCTAVVTQAAPAGNDSDSYHCAPLAQ